ncbi:hypothetical protein K2173_025261 [Erythroxylum novogranatense]|uniref:Acid phosphatase/vanadium-dependent haloperoxidase-related protein n=1 Tax=Erythroxylum novogranatense TaxID=1862640 RepID=A0AAV8UDC3_9ROSI|nr:hypothetical protein K2173_025261 [Erythroxylum novogranatense]
MDSLTLKNPSFNSLSFNSLLPSPRTKLLCNAQLSFVCSCYRNPKTRNPTCCVYRFSMNSFWGSMKGLASSQGKKWVSRLQAYSDKSAKAVNQYGGNHLQNGSFGSALLSVTSNAKHRISPFVATLAANPTFVSALLSWFIAQSIKVVLNFFIEKKWDLRILFASGGMPSSHSALCTALTTAVALCHGVADSLFPVCLGFSLIVMYDAIGVRRHAGMQAEVLNVIIEDLFQGHPISQRKLKELLGHTPSQVLAGAVLGILVACFCCQGCLVAT